MASGPIDLDELKPVALKRKAIAQGDKVRYRVYKIAQEYVAVIAENALMAMKISGVSNPHRILRDLPLAGRSIDAERLVPHHVQPTVFIRPNKMPDAPPKFEPAQPDGPRADEVFTAIPVGSLHEHKPRNLSTIDVHTLLQALGEVDVPMAAAPPEPEMPRMVEEPVATPPPAPEDTGEVLSPEEVERLLNEPRA